MRHILIAAAMLMVGIAAVEARTCHRSPEGAGWAWRQIDGKRCWYKGSRHISKSRLHWPVYARDDKPPPAPKKEPAMSAEDEALLRSYWPVLPRDTFDDRFNGEKPK